MKTPAARLALAVMSATGWVLVTGAAHAAGGEADAKLTLDYAAVPAVVMFS